jgi:hypothetical protein
LSESFEPSSDSSPFAYAGLRRDLPSSLTYGITNIDRDEQTEHI